MRGPEVVWYLAVAASEVVVGLGLIVAIARKRIDLDVDKLSTLRG